MKGPHFPGFGGPSRLLAAVLWVLGAVGFFAAEALAAAALPGYGYDADYISTLGEPAVSPRAALMNAAFVLQGVCFAAAALLIARNRLWFMVFALCNGIGNILVAVVHSGQGSAWHGVGAALAIAGGNCAAIAGATLVSGSRGHRVASMTLGGVGLLCLLVTATSPAWVGAWERAAVYPIFAWQLLTAVQVLRRGGQAGSGLSMS
ncbi:DUF998 domain-containing protein [Mycobacterium sp. NPDC003323]